MLHPVVDLHCDLLSYLVRIPGASIHSKDDIGASLPYLRKGNVNLQVLAIYTATEPGSAQSALQQAEEFSRFIHHPDFAPVRTTNDLNHTWDSGKIGITAAIENASGLCEVGEPIKNAFARLKTLVSLTGRILYISLTHHTENRFGGGNYSNNVGLKADGKTLLDFLSGSKICIDLAHTSDALAFDVLTYITTQNLDLQPIASHSNFRSVCDHVRNLPDELATEIIHQKGLIGINFLRDYVHPFDPGMLYNHINYGLKLGGKDQLAFGADFFYTHDFPDPDRHPMFPPEMADAGQYPNVLRVLAERMEDKAFVAKIASANALAFLRRIWGGPR